MAQIIADRIKDATISTGNTNITLANTAPAGYKTFASGFGASVSKQVSYCIANPTNTLVRSLVTSNSSGTQPTKISFPAGTKDVFCTTPSASMLVQDSNGAIEIANNNASGSQSLTTAVHSTGTVPTSLSITCVDPTGANQSGTYLSFASAAGTGTGDGGSVTIAAGYAPGAGAGGAINITAGGSNTGSGGNISLTAGDGDGTTGGISLAAGNASASSSVSGGIVEITSGTAFGSGSNGYIVISIGSQTAITISPADATTNAAVKIGLFGVTAVVRPTTANTTAGTFVVGSGTAVNQASTFSGYTIGQIAAALVKLGILT
jgi:hypothetical protein